MGIIGMEPSQMGSLAADIYEDGLNFEKSLIAWENELKEHIKREGEADTDVSEKDSIWWTGNRAGEYLDYLETQRTELIKFKNNLHSYSVTLDEIKNSTVSTDGGSY